MSLQTFFWENWLRIAVGTALVCVGTFIAKFILHRRLYRDLPSPEHSLILGNLKVIGEWIKKYPADSYPQAMFVDLANAYNFHGLYYMDLYPFGKPMLFITDPALVVQIQSQPRHRRTLSFLRGLVGSKGIFSSRGSEWAAQRSWFSPAFSAANILTLIPGMVDETLVFREKLTQLASSQQKFSMMDLALRLAIDVIGASGFGIRLKSQTEDCEIFNALNAATAWTSGQTASFWHKLLSPYMMDWNTWKLDRLLGEVIQEKYAGKMEDNTSKSILDLALKGYQKDNGRLEKGSDITKDPKFMQVALDNFKTFLTAGHDTTSSVITYVFYLLSTHPDILEQVREEHNAVFGSDLETTIERLKSQPALTNKLPLTYATIKEALRLYPIGFTIREAPFGSIVTYEGRKYPIDNHLICNLASSMHRSPEHWTNPNEFIPARFLDASSINNAAYLPFEKGPRNCIGQQLALVETKVIMVMTLRFFDFTPMLNQDGPEIDGWGGKAYQVLALSAKPKDGIPMTVKLRK
ncbi:hypothetical protein BP6252_01707 [Coleophoma cylindrospora]|uniref:Cytochrome P450 n=1 Tax=Coleophoma cylindrospora TaxID=1849047 RepID=A0A3D8STR0_9HELO|nr:hypothetical protein BP6252_01707 [Coleophoma cylindrospora]